MVSACDECRPISKSPGRNLIGFAWPSWARADHLDWDETTECTVRISRLFSLSLSLRCRHRIDGSVCTVVSSVTLICLNTLQFVLYSL